MESGRSHYERDGKNGQYNRGEMNLLLDGRQFLLESLVEDRDRLKTKQRLNAGEHHATLFEDVPSGRVQG